DWGFSVQESSNGKYIIAGYTASFGAGYYDVYLIKTHADGETLWTRVYGGGEDDRGFSIQETSDGGYIIAGITRTFGAGSYDFYLIKTDENGNALWEKTFGGADDDWGFSVIESSDGGYIIVGSTESYGEGERDVYVIKTDVNGDTLWTKTYGGEKDDVGVSIQKTSDSGYIIAGRTTSFGSGYYDVYLIKINDDGDTQWAKTYGGTEYDGGISIQQTSDGGYIIGGDTESYGEGEKDIYLIKIDETGSVLWTKTYGGTEDDGCLSVQETSDGGYIVTGFTTLSNIHTWNSDVYLIKTDANGSALWTKTYGGAKFDIGYSVQETSDGGYIIAGATCSEGSNNDVYLIKIKE
ncbi:hypothetical protein KAU34_10145, partial [candidate division WOR-3 bacterium]|nr:hypothetical protein [candidate division WOR-3 bacterium]